MNETQAESIAEALRMADRNSHLRGDL